MRILFLTHRLPFAPNRGDRIRAYYLLRAMSRFADVSLFSLIHDDEEAAAAGQVPFARRVETARVPRMRNWLLGALRLASARPLTHSLLDAPDATVRLARMVADDRPDLVVAFCSGMARLAMQPPLDAMPFVLDMVDVDSVKWAELAARTGGPRSWVFSREARTLGAFETAAAARARVSLVVNQREHDALARLAPGARVEVLENGVEIDAFRPPGPPAASKTVVFCGVMNYEPNEEAVRWFAEDVWPVVRARHPDARFVVIGAGAGPALHALARKDASIEVTGRVDSVQARLWEAAVSVAPIHVARGLQNKVLEALAAGLPVVVTPAVFTGLPGEARPGCVERADAAGFAEATSDLLSRTGEERRQWAARASLSNLEWPARLERLEPLLRQALTTRR